MSQNNLKGRKNENWLECSARIERPFITGIAARKKGSRGILDIGYWMVFFLLSGFAIFNAKFVLAKTIRRLPAFTLQI